MEQGNWVLSGQAYFLLSFVVDGCLIYNTEKVILWFLMPTNKNFIYSVNLKKEKEIEKRKSKLKK